MLVQQLMGPLQLAGQDALQDGDVLGDRLLDPVDLEEVVHPDPPDPGVDRLQGLAKLPASFAMVGEMGGFDAVALQKYHWVEKIDHVHSPGNSSGIVDGAALVLIGSEKAGKEMGLKPRGRIVATAVSGADPTIMLTGPAPATRKALAKAGLEAKDIDLFEINEAFASVAMRFMKDLGISHDITGRRRADDVRKAYHVLRALFDKAS